MDAALAYRLVYALTAAGFLLLALEIFLTGVGMGTIGILALLGATGIAYYGCGIDVGSILLLIVTTGVSIGFLVTIVCFPRSPLARRVLSRGAASTAEGKPESE